MGIKPPEKYHKVTFLTDLNGIGPLSGCECQQGRSRGQACRESIFVSIARCQTSDTSNSSACCRAQLPSHHIPILKGGLLPESHPRSRDGCLVAMILVPTVQLHRPLGESRSVRSERDNDGRWLTCQLSLRGYSPSRRALS